jgi:hypothetical protein
LQVNNLLIVEPGKRTYAPVFRRFLNKPARAERASLTAGGPEFGSAATEPSEGPSRHARASSDLQRKTAASSVREHGARGSERVSVDIQTASRASASTASTLRAFKAGTIMPVPKLVIREALLWMTWPYVVLLCGAAGAHLQPRRLRADAHAAMLPASDVRERARGASRCRPWQLGQWQLVCEQIA